MAVFRMLFGVPFRGLLGSTVVEVPVSSTTGPGWPSLSLSLSPIFWYRHGTLAPRARRLRIQLRIPGEVLCLKGDPEMTGHRPSVRDGGMEGWRRQFLGGFAPQSGSLCFAGFSVAC